MNLGTDGNMEMTAKNLRARRSEIEEERKQIDSGRPSVADALQKLRGGGTNGISATNAAVKAVPSVSWQEVEAAASLCLTYVTNILKNPDDSRRWRIRLSNPIFQRKLGRFGGKAQFLMSAIGSINSTGYMRCGIRTVH